jgi:hypothetical protein
MNAETNLLGLLIATLGGTAIGLESGIPGGVLGGLLGGMVTEVMPPPPTPAKPRRVGGDVQEPALIHRVEPVYPPVAVSGELSVLLSSKLQ